MTKTKWIDGDGGELIGDVGFLIERSNQLKGTEHWTLADEPARGNEDHMPHLHGWCGTYNDTSTTAHGMAKVIRIAKNGRVKVETITKQNNLLQGALEELGYPELIEQDKEV